MRSKNMAFVSWAVWLIAALFFHPVPASIAEAKGEQKATDVSDYIGVVDVVVRDTKNGNRIIDTFEAKDFVVRERRNGREWKAVELKAAYGGNRKLLLVLVLDVSASVFKTQAGPIKEGLINFIGAGKDPKVQAAIRPGEDLVLLIPFSTTVDASRQFTVNMEKLAADINRLKSVGTTALFSALAAAEKRIDAEEQAQKELLVQGGKSGDEAFAKVMILLTDGQENASLTGAELSAAKGNKAKAYELKKKETEKLVMRPDVPVYVLFTGKEYEEDLALISESTTGMPVGYKKYFGSAREWLESKIAESTGGKFFKFLHSRQQSDAYRSIREEVTHKQSLVFWPDDQEAGEVSREIEVRVVKKDAQGNPVTKKNGEKEADNRYKVSAPPRIYF